MLIKKNPYGTVAKWLLTLCLLSAHPLSAALAWEELNNGSFSSPSPRTLSSMAFDSSVFPNGQMLLFGGVDENGQSLNDTWTWNEFNNTWQLLIPPNTPANPSPRNGASMAFLPSIVPNGPGQLILFGGTNDFTDFNDTWSWNGNNNSWSLVSNPSANNPPPRAFACMASAPISSNVLILFGGLTPQAAPLNDTWIWDGTTWVQLSLSVSPPARFGASMTFDPINRVLVLFGGSNGSQVLNDTWLWNGSTWTQVFPAESPSPRALASMTFDSSITQTVLFGGAGNLVNQFFGDTWLWSGSNWSLVSTSSTINPAARSGASMAFDGISQHTLLFGGGAGFQLFNDTWTLGQVPQIISVTPNNGPLDGGTEVTIIGIGLAGVTMVKFGANPAINFTIISPTTIQAISPPLTLPATSATVDITLSNSFGTSPITVADQFTYTGVFPPTHLKGFQKVKKCGGHTRLINVLSWQPPVLGEQPVAYKIYKDRTLKKLIAEIPSTKKHLKFHDRVCKAKKKYFYFIVSISDDGDVSSPAKLTIKGKL